MDLIEAKVEAAARSKRQGKKVHIVAVEDGECILSDAPLKGTIHTFVNGSEVKPDNPQEVVNEVASKKDIKKSAKAAAEPKAAKSNTVKVAAESKATPKKEKDMKTKVKKTAKKSAPKKVAAKKSNGTPDGKKVSMKVKDIVKHLKAGRGVYNPTNGRKFNLAFQEARPNQDAEREVIYAG